MTYLVLHHDFKLKVGQINELQEGIIDDQKHMIDIFDANEAMRGDLVYFKLSNYLLTIQIHSSQELESIYIQYIIISNIAELKLIRLYKD